MATNCSVKQTIMRELLNNNFIDSKMNIIGKTQDVFPYIQSLNQYARDNFGLTEDLIETIPVKSKAGYFTKVNIKENLVEQIDNLRNSESFNSRQQDGSNTTKLRDIISGNQEVKKSDFQKFYSFLTEAESQYKNKTGSGYKSNTRKGREAIRLRKLAEKRGFMLSPDYIGSLDLVAIGGESSVYTDPKNNKIIKFNNNPFYDSWTEFFATLSVHNALFPDTAYSFKGFYNNEEGNLSIALQQDALVDEADVMNSFQSYLDDSIGLDNLIDDLGPKLEPLLTKLREAGFIIPESTTTTNSFLDNYLMGILNDGPKQFNAKDLDGRYYNPELGVNIGDLHPGNIFLVDNEARIIDSVIDLDRYEFGEDTFSSRYDSEQPREVAGDNSSEYFDDDLTPNTNLPLGDNYTEFLKYKRDQLGSINQEISKLNTAAKTTRDKVDIERRRKDLNQRRKTLESQIQTLEGNEVPFMFKTMFDDLDMMEEALRGEAELKNIDDIKKKLDFYKTFVLGENDEYTAGSLREYNIPDFDKLVTRVFTLDKDYTDLVRGKVTQLLEESPEVQETLKNTGYNVSDLLKANSDLSWADSQLLGLMSSNSNDTVLPQFLQMLMHRTNLKHSHSVDQLVDNLTRVENKTGLYNPEWIFGKDSKGENNGFIADLYSEEWYSSLRGLGNLVRDYINSESKDKKKAHQAIMSWFSSNTNVVDFTKIPQIREAYLNNPAYSSYFEGTTDQESQEYDARLRSEYGPKYEDLVYSTLQKLQVLEEMKNDGVDNDLYFAQKNIWELIKNFKNPSIKNKQNIRYGETGTDVAFFNDFYSIPMLPKSTTISSEFNDNFELVQSEKSTGFINQDFKNTIMSNQDNLDYFNAIKDLSEYINNTYQTNTTGRLSYPKIKNSWFESSHDTLKAIKAGKLAGFKKISQDTLDAWKALYYEQGSYAQKDSKVHSNYSDRSKAEIKNLARLYRAQGLSSEEAYKKASEQVLKDYSLDVSRDLKAVAEMAALHNARVEIAPIADAIFDTYKGITDSNNQERKRGMAHLEYYIDHIIYNNVNKYRDSNKLEGTSWNPGLKPLLEVLDGVTKGKINEKSAHYLSEAEQELFKGYKELLSNGYIPDSVRLQDIGYDLTKRGIKDKDGNEKVIYEDHGTIITPEQFKEKYAQYLQDKIEKLGLDLNLAGAIDGVLRTVIYKALALNPISGIFNRIEGLNSAYIMDSTGTYWTEGNLDAAKQMMSWWNLKKLSFGKLSLMDKNKAKQMRMFELLLRKMPGVLQDRKNELQRNVSDSQIDIENFNVFKAAVDHPESKNQGSIMLAKMMDFVLKDAQGNPLLNEDGSQMKLLDRDTQQFNAFDIDENGLLVAKPGFEHLNDISQFDDLVVDMSVAVSRSQGNYSTNDIMQAKKTIWGRAGTMFMTWLPEHLNQRFGIAGEGQVDLYRRDVKQEGRYVAGWRANKFNAAALMLGGLGISYGMLGTVGLFGAGLVGAWVYKKYLSKYSNQENIQRDVDHAKEFTQMLLSLGIEFINYPGHLLSSIPGVSKVRNLLPENKTFANTTMSEKERQAMRAMTRELAIMLSWLGFKMAVMALYKGIGGDDDDDKSPRRMKYYFIQNQLSRSITSLNGYYNPYAFIKDNSRNSFLSEMTDVFKLLHSIGTFDWDGIKDNATAPIPIPTMLDRTVRNIAGSREAIYENKIDYASQVDFNKIPSPLRWTSELFKDYMSDGEYSDKKAYLKARKEVRDKMKEELMDKYGNNKEVVKQILDAKMKQTVGSKYKDLSYADAAENIESGEVIQDPKKKASRSVRNKFKDKLKEQGVDNEDISTIMREEFRGR